MTLYSSSVAAASYWVMEKAAVYRLVTTDAFGQPFVFYRVFQWRVADLQVFLAAWPLPSLLMVEGQKPPPH